MTGWTQVEYNPVSGVSTWIMVDGDKTYVQERQDVSRLLDANTAQRNISASGWAGDYHSVARIPLAMIHDPNAALHQAVKEGDEKWLNRFLNDSDNAKLRTKEGRL